MALDTTQLWLICISVAAPIAGVVGFAVQLRTVKQLRLENEKLSLEIEQLEKAKAEADRRIVIPTTEEVEKYNDVLFSAARFRRRTIDRALSKSELLKARLTNLIAALKNFLLYFILFAFIFYLIYDVSRVALWLWSFI